MRIDVLTLFPKMFSGPMDESIVKRAIANGRLDIHIHNLRDFTRDRHRTCDDKPFGGGPGMVMKPEPIFEAVEAILKKRKMGTGYFLGKKKRKGLKNSLPPLLPKKGGPRSRIILLTPQGRRFDQMMAQRLSKFKHLILICGHYEGVDERVRKFLTEEEISIGDYITTGGELPAMVLIDSVVRLVTGVLGDPRSAHYESFQGGLLEYPQYTRPAVFRGMKAPSVLLSGDHEAIHRWRQREALKRTRRKRPDLLRIW